MKKSDARSVEDWISGNARVAVEASSIRAMLARASESLEFRRQIVSGETDEMIIRDLMMLNPLCVPFASSDWRFDGF
jgi:hypothetical protein